MSDLPKGIKRLVVLVALLIAACDFPGKPDPVDRPTPANQVVDFDILYKTNCAGCHGANGKLGPAPPLNDPLFLAIVPDTELLRVITEGRAVSPTQRTPMPAFGLSKGSAQGREPANVPAELRVGRARQQGPLTETQIRILSEGIKKRWGAPSPSSESTPTYLSSTGTAGGDNKKGSHVFARACAGCHGDEGKGVERDGRLRRRINDPALLALISDQELRRYIITGRPDLGMPPYNQRPPDFQPPHFKPLTSAETDDLVALLASWRETGVSKSN